MLKYSRHNLKVKYLFVYAHKWVRYNGCLCFDAECAFYCDYDITYSDDLNTYVQYFFCPIATLYDITLEKLKNLPIRKTSVPGN